MQVIEIGWIFVKFYKHGRLCKMKGKCEVSKIVNPPTPHTKILGSMSND